MANSKLSDSKRLKSIDRRSKAYTLRVDGHSYRDIAKETGVSLRQAWKDINNSIQEIADLEQDKKKELRQLELDRLDKLFYTYWSLAKSGDIAAGTMILKIADRRAKFLGLDMPAQIDINQNVSIGPSWNAQQLAILDALRMFPDARAAVGKALMSLNPLEGELADDSEQ